MLWLFHAPIACAAVCACPPSPAVTSSIRHLAADLPAKTVFWVTAGSNSSRVPSEYGILQWQAFFLHTAHYNLYWCSSPAIIHCCTARTVTSFSEAQKTLLYLFVSGKLSGICYSNKFIGVAVLPLSYTLLPAGKQQQAISRVTKCKCSKV